MSIHDEIQTSNEQSRKEIENSKNEHLAFLEQQRVASENAMQNSVKGNWERLIAKRGISQVLRKLPLPRLQ